MDLPGDLSLPLARGSQYWYWLGGRVALDYVNTLRERWWRQVETLVTPDDLAEWLVQAGVTTDELTIALQVLTEARELREAIDAGVTASLAQESLPQHTLATINQWLRYAAVGLELRHDGLEVELGPRQPADPARYALGLVAGDAAEMLTGPERSRIRVCASSDCSARFYDRSPGAARQWCSSGGCGNRERARRHRRRHAASR